MATEWPPFPTILLRWHCVRSSKLHLNFHWPSLNLCRIVEFSNLHKNWTFLHCVRLSNFPGFFWQFFFLPISTGDNPQRHFRSKTRRISRQTDEKSEPKVWTRIYKMSRFCSLSALRKIVQRTSGAAGGAVDGLTMPFDRLKGSSYSSEPCKPKLHWKILVVPGEKWLLKESVLV